MGAWGIGPFSNDEAADLLGELAELGATEQHELLTQALQLPPPRTYLEISAASTAVAAAALLAMTQGYEPPEEEARHVPNLQLEDDAQLRTAAADALRRVQGSDSEWVDLWDEAGESHEVTRVLAEMARHLP